MTRNEKIIRASANNLRLEGMHVTEREKQIAMDCLTGKKKFSDAYAEIKNRYKKFSN